MITLYNKSETNFEHNGIGSIEQDIIDPKIHWIDNGVFSFEFDYPLFAKHGLEITNSSIIKARDPEQDNLFFVYKIIPSMGYIKVYCYHIFYKLAFNTINDTNIVGKTGQGALTQLSGATQYPHKFQLTSNLTNIANSRVVRKNPVEFLLDSNLDNSFINHWGGHIIRHGFKISMNQSYGSNKGYKIQHKKDLMGYEATIDETTVVTRIRPVGYDGLLLPEIYIDSLLINNYPEPRIQEYAYSDVKVGKGEGEFATAALAYAELRRLAKLEFSQNKIDVPRGIYKVDFVNLKETEEYKNFAPLKQILPGDIVAVEHEKDGISIRSQMVEYNWDPLLKEYIDLTLGNYERSFSSTVNKIDKIQTDIKNINTQIELVYFSANGKNKTYTGVTEPVIDQNSTEGDLWFKKNGDKTEMWILRNINGVLHWIVEISDATQEELRAAVSDAVAEIANVTKSANDAVAKADQAIADAGFSQVDSTKAIADSLSALSVANTAKLDASGALVKADTAISDTGTAIVNAASAISRVSAVEETTGSLTTSYDALTNTVGLKADKTVVDGINSKVITQGTSISANASAIALKANSTTVSTLTNTVTTQGTAIDANADAISLKANSSTVNALSGTVASHSTSISANADAIALKANSSTVNTLAGTVSTQGTAITANDKEIALKADSSTVNTLSGKVTSNTSAIAVNATAITARLTSTQVESAISAKNYVNTTTLAATASGLNVSIAKVSTELSDLTIGGVNLAIGTHGEFNAVDTLNSFSGITNKIANLQRVYLKGLSAGDVVTVRLVYEYTNIVSASGQTAKIWIQGSGNVTDWSSGGFGASPSVSFSGSGTHIFEYSFTLNDAHITNAYWSPNIRHDYVQSGSVKFKRFKVEKGNKATDWSPAPEDLTTLEQFTTLEATVNGIQTIVGNKANQSQVTQIASQVSTKVESSTYNSKMTQLDSSINLRVVAGDVTAAILADKTIKDTRNDNQLPSWYFSNYPQQTVEEFKSRIALGVPGYATFGQLSTKVLWYNNSGGSITQIFSSSDGVFQRISNGAASAWNAWDKIAESGKLISQINVSTEGILLQGKRIQLDGDVTMTTAFIADIKAIDIAADRITTGTLNAANVNLINLNVSKLVGNTSDFVRSAWNSVAGGGVSIAGGGVVTTGSNGASTLLQNGVLYTKTPNGSGLGTIGYALDSTEDLFSIDILRGNSFTIRYQNASGSTSYNDIIGYYDYLDRVTINKSTQINGPLNMNNQVVSNVKSITTPKIDYMSGRATYVNGDYMTHTSYSGFQFYMNGSVGFVVSRNHSTGGNSASLYAGLNMQGYSITNQSDKRLKTDIVGATRSALNAIKAWNFVDYKWAQDSFGGKPEGSQFGLIAQDTPELMTFEEKDDYYGIDSSRQIMLNSKGIQELIFKYEELLQKIDKLESVA